MRMMKRLSGFESESRIGRCSGERLTMILTIVSNVVHDNRQRQYLASPFISNYMWHQQVRSRVRSAMRGIRKGLVAHQQTSVATSERSNRRGK